MSCLSMYRNDYIKDNDLKYMYINHTGQFVDFMERRGFGDRIFDIIPQQLKGSVKEFIQLGYIQTVSTMENHLNAIKHFFVYLHKHGKADNVFYVIKDYEEFKNQIIQENGLRPKAPSKYIENDYIRSLLDYLNKGMNKYSNMTMFNFYFKIALLVPAKRHILAYLKVKDFGEKFDHVKINGLAILLTRALSMDIQREIIKTGKNYDKEDYFFSIFYSGKSYSENVINVPFYYALKEVGYDVSNQKNRTFSIEAIRNTGIINFTRNGTNPYLLSRLTGLSLNTIDGILKKFKVEIDYNGDVNRKMNIEICKNEFYQYI